MKSVNKIIKKLTGSLGSSEKILNELDNIPFDMMFLCKSPFYTPGEFQLVYNIYTDYIKYHHSDKLKEVITRTNVHNY